MPIDVKAQLKKMKNYKSQINADHVWVGVNRSQLLQQISNTVHEENNNLNLERIWEGMSIFLPSRFVYQVVRPVAVFVLVGMIATSGWIASVSATQNCLPGEVCYGVKMAVEKTQEIVVGATGSSEDKTQMHMDFAKKRAVEVKKVVESQVTDAPQKAGVAIKKLEESIKTAGENLKDVSQKNPEKVVAVVQEMTVKTKEISETLKAVEEKNTEVNVSDVKQTVKEAGIEAVVTVVETKEGGKVQVDDQLVKDMVKKEIASALSETTSLTSKVDTVSRSASSTPNITDVLVTSTTMPVAVNSITTSTDPLVGSTSISLKQVVSETVKVVDQNQTIIKTSLDTASTLVENNQLKEALVKVKEASQVVQQTSQVVADTQKIVTDTVKTSTQTTIIENSSTTTSEKTTTSSTGVTSSSAISTNTVNSSTLKQ